MKRIELEVNGITYEHEVEPRLLLVHYLREVLNLTGTMVGCNTSNCGACTVLMNGESVKSCTLLAVQADGQELLTVQGLAENGEWHPMQKAFHENHGLQCGYCDARHDHGFGQHARREPGTIGRGDPGIAGG